MAYVWRRIVLLKHGYAELNEATGGAFGFNTAAKILAWGGICVIVVLLLHKVHQIQEELDPVGQGLRQLQAQLQNAKTSVATSAQASEDELDGLSAKAQRLKASLDSASKAERDQSEPNLLKARQEARDLAAALAKEADGLQQIAEERSSFARSLADYRDALLQGQELEAAQARAIADGGASAQNALRGLSAAADRTTALVSGAAPRLQLDQLASTLQALQSRLGELQRQVERVNQQLASMSTQQTLTAAPKLAAAPLPAAHPMASASASAQPAGKQSR